MQAIQISENGGLDVLKVVDIPIPTASGTQIVVHNRAIGVNFVDVQHRQGGYYNPIALPFIPGIEAAGIVHAIGESVTDFRVGDRVAYAGYMGGNYAEYTLVKQDVLIPLPDAIDFDTAAASLLQGMTAYVLSHIVYPIQKGNAVLVHAAAGGVGMMLVQLAKLRGATVIATVSSAEKATFAHRYGADYTINYTQNDFAEQVLNMTAHEGVHVVYDAIGKNTFEQSLRSLRKRGHLVIYGQSSGAPDPFDINRLSGITAHSARGSNSITWTAASDFMDNQHDLLTCAQAVLDLLANGQLTADIAQRLPLHQAAEAHRLLEARQVMGKLLLVTV